MADRLSQSDRKEKLRAWRDAERAKARAAFPLPDAQLAVFFERLEVLHDENGCCHDVRNAITAIESLGLCDDNANRLMAWCNDHGGYCDCEISSNSFQHWHENRSHA